MVTFSPCYGCESTHTILTSGERWSLFPVLWLRVHTHHLDIGWALVTFFPCYGCESTRTINTHHFEIGTCASMEHLKHFGLSSRFGKSLNSNRYLKHFGLSSRYGKPLRRLSENILLACSRGFYHKALWTVFPIRQASPSSERQKIHLARSEV